MAVHIEPATIETLALTIRLYIGVPENEPAFRYRLEYDAVCTAIWSPGDRSVQIVGLHGTITKASAIDIMEKLAADYKVDVIYWERSDGRHTRRKRVGHRRWVNDGRSHSNR